MNLSEWAKRRLADELVLTREASTVGRRAFHEGVAASLAFVAGDIARARNITATIVADYTGVRRSQGLDGMRVGTHMIRGVADFLGAHEAAGAADTLAAWEAENAVAAYPSEADANA